MSNKKSHNSKIFNIGLGKRIEERLSNLRGKTQKGLSIYVDVSENMIKKWKTGTEPGSFKMILVCEYLECSIDWLLTGIKSIPANYKTISDKKRREEDVHEHIHEIIEILKRLETSQRFKILKVTETLFPDITEN